MRISLLAVLTGLAATILTPGSATAQRIDSPYRFVDSKRDFGPYVGYVLGDGGAVDLGPNNGLAFGVRFGFRISDPIQLTANATYFPTDRDVIDPTADDAPVNLGTTPMNLLLLSGRLQFNLTGTRSWNRLMPYVIGGLGIAFDTSGEVSCGGSATDPTCDLLPTERFDFGTSLLGQIGIGTAVIVSDRIGLRLTIENNIWKLNAPTAWSNTGLDLPRVPPDSDWTNNLTFGIVSSYWF